ncbi:MAG: hypothetical protein KatS3mg102_0170 [Planctomycetota bacterium]|nr:MAG: hypothetical protein KatS3mg102_0170 [Planctomycetota bacterium]
MWIARNTTRGRLRFPGLALTIAPGAEVDLDCALGRSRAEQSNQILVAFEEGYLETVRKDPAPPAAVRGGTGAAGGGLDDARLAARLEAFKDSLRGELQQLRAALAGDVRTILGGLRVARDRLDEQRRRVLADQSLSEAEIRARLAFLEEQEMELVRNFDALGRAHAPEAGGEVAAKADLLSRLG